MVQWIVSGIIILASIYLIIKTLPGGKNSEEKVQTITGLQEGDDFDKIENGIHLRTGLIDAPGRIETIGNCTTCHSSKLIIQNRMDKEHWAATIRWMQETQNLWDLGANEEIIINYLVTNYPPKKKGRRANLEGIEWYELRQ
ncbi:MAG: monoheme cytochrome C [Saprospiraceae bacterium]|nr:monoheme cytochrome C [Saprospiraceae bacterium]